MPRKKLIRDSLNPYHVCVRSHNKEWFDLPMDKMWEIFSEYLYLTKHIFNLEIISFVLMDNHFHLLLRTPLKNLDQAMNYFLREVSRVIGFEAGRINQKFGGPYHWSLIESNRHFLCAYKYVYRNPVDAGLVDRVELYPYSTLFGLLGQSPLIIPVANDIQLIENTEGCLEWLNQSYKSTEERKAIKDALNKSKFIFGKDKDRMFPQVAYNSGLGTAYLKTYS